MIEVKHPLGLPRTAWFSEDRRYRYSLEITWEQGPRVAFVNFIMLNPSTADEMTNDPTVARCAYRARAEGYGGLVVTNLFALRSTDPKALYGAADPIGPENDEILRRVATGCLGVICGWGAHGKHLGRGPAVSAMLRADGVRLHVLRLNADGQPAHPLYLPYSLSTKIWKEC